MAETKAALPRAERALLVSVEFTGERRRLGAAALAARRAAAGTDEDVQGAMPAADGEDVEAARAEFEELARSAGAETVATLVQRRVRPDAATLVGTGKVDEILGVAESSQADLVLFDHDLSPSQMRNLGGAAAVPGD